MSSSPISPPSSPELSEAPAPYDLSKLYLLTPAYFDSVKVPKHDLYYFYKAAALFLGRSKDTLKRSYNALIKKNPNYMAKARHMGTPATTYTETLNLISRLPGPHQGPMLTFLHRINAGVTAASPEIKALINHNELTIPVQERKTAIAGIPELSQGHIRPAPRPNNQAALAISPDDINNRKLQAAASRLRHTQFVEESRALAEAAAHRVDHARANSLISEFERRQMRFINMRRDETSAAEGERRLEALAREAGYIRRQELLAMEHIVAKKELAYSNDESKARHDMQLQIIAQETEMAKATHAIDMLRLKLKEAKMEKALRSILGKQPRHGSAENPIDLDDDEEEEEEEQEEQPSKRRRAERFLFVDERIQHFKNFSLDEHQEVRYDLFPDFNKWVKATASGLWKKENPGVKPYTINSGEQIYQVKDSNLVRKAFYQVYLACHYPVSGDPRTKPIPSEYY